MNKNATRNYRIQIYEEGKWRTLALEDITLTSDSEAYRLALSFAVGTGNEYRAQFQHGRSWYPVIAPIVP